MRKCPCCGSTKIVTSSNGDLNCKHCNYMLLSEETRKKLKKDEVFQKNEE